jgi:type II secretory pathway component PulF
MSLTSILTSDFLNKIIKEVRKKENMDKIHGNIIDPLIEYTYNKIYPYILVLFSILVLIFLIIVVILLLILRPRFFNKM